jgi:hypothetical protein
VTSLWSVGVGRGGVEFGRVQVAAFEFVADGGLGGGGEVFVVAGEGEEIGVAHGGVESFEIFWAGVHWERW